MNDYYRCQSSAHSSVLNYMGENRIIYSISPSSSAISNGFSRKLSSKSLLNSANRTGQLVDSYKKFEASKSLKHRHAPRSPYKRASVAKPNKKVKTLSSSSTSLSPISKRKVRRESRKLNSPVTSFVNSCDIREEIGGITPGIITTLSSTALANNNNAISIICAEYNTDTDSSLEYYGPELPEGGVTNALSCISNYSLTKPFETSTMMSLPNRPQISPEINGIDITLLNELREKEENEDSCKNKKLPLFKKRKNRCNADIPVQIPPNVATPVSCNGICEYVEAKPLNEKGAPMLGKGNQWDICCWLCHDFLETTITSRGIKRRKIIPPSHVNNTFAIEAITLCKSCPRSFHTNCVARYRAGRYRLKPYLEPPKEVTLFTCPECKKNAAERAAISDSNGQNIEELNSALGISFQKFQDNIQARYGSIRVLTNPEYIVHPMNFVTIESKIQSCAYVNPYEYYSDIKYIYHNALVYRATVDKVEDSNDTILEIMRETQQIFQEDATDINVCHFCFASSHNNNQSFDKSNTSWFEKPCPKLHPLVWATPINDKKFWPGKVYRIREMPSLSYTAPMCTEIDIKKRLSKTIYFDVCFFGTLQRSWVPFETCYLLSQLPLTPNIVRTKRSVINESDAAKLNNLFFDLVKKDPEYNEAIFSVKRHILNIQKTYLDGHTYPYVVNSFHFPIKLNKRDQTLNKRAMLNIFRKKLASIQMCLNTKEGDKIEKDVSEESGNPKSEKSECANTRKSRQKFKFIRKGPKSSQSACKDPEVIVGDRDMGQLPNHDKIENLNCQLSNMDEDVAANGEGDYKNVNQGSVCSNCEVPFLETHFPTLNEHPLGNEAQHNLTEEQLANLNSWNKRARFRAPGSCIHYKPHLTPKKINMGMKEYREFTQQTSILEMNQIWHRDEESVYYQDV